MPLNGYALSKAVRNALQEEFIKPKKYLLPGVDGSVWAHCIIEAAILKYIAKNLEITYTWDAKDSATSTTDPDDSFKAVISLSGDGKLTPPGVAYHANAMVIWAGDLAALIRDGITIEPPTDYILAPPLSFHPAGAIEIQMHGENTHEAAWDTIGCAIVQGIYDSFADTTARAGTHLSFVADGDALGAGAAGMAIACTFGRPEETAVSADAETDAGEAEDDGTAGGSTTHGIIGSQAEPSPEQNLVWVIHEGEPEVLFEKEAASGPYAYVWKYGLRRILLKDNSPRGGVFAWKLARDDGWSIQKVLDDVQPVVWRFLRALCDRFSEIQQINITGLTRPPQVSNDPHTPGLAVDIGEILFAAPVLNLLYERRNLGIRPPANTRYWQIRVWAWNWDAIPAVPNRRYVEQYIDPWYLQGALGYPAGWIENTFSNILERAHCDHLHITFRG
jgi:hypothetical protein